MARELLGLQSTAFTKFHTKREDCCGALLEGLVRRKIIGRRTVQKDLYTARNSQREANILAMGDVTGHNGDKEIARRIQFRDKEGWGS